MGFEAGEAIKALSRIDFVFVRFRHQWTGLEDMRSVAQLYKGHKRRIILRRDCARIKRSGGKMAHEEGLVKILEELDLNCDSQEFGLPCNEM